MERRSQENVLLLTGIKFVSLERLKSPSCAILINESSVGNFGIKTECMRSCGSMPGGVLEPSSFGHMCVKKGSYCRGNSDFG